MLVVDQDKILNKGGLRNEEFINHKILDLAGDFLLSGQNSWKCKMLSRWP